MEVNPGETCEWVRRPAAVLMVPWFHVHGFPLRDKAGRIVHWCVLQTDIDDQKRAEALLAGENRLLEM